LIRLLGWCTVLCAIAVCSALAARAVDSGLLSGPGTAEAAPAPGWEFASPALTELAAITLQICTGETIAKAVTGADALARQDGNRLALQGRYEQAAADYTRQVGTLVLRGERRPWDVPAMAPSLVAGKARLCPKPPAAVAKPAAAAVFIDPSTRFITPEQLDAAAVEAGWPMGPGWWPDMRKIIQCESGSLDTHAFNTSDPNGGSYGLAQLNGRQHFDHAGEDFEKRYDPVVNLRTALWLRTVRGHFGGAGGWKTCAERYGID